MSDLAFDWLEIIWGHSGVIYCTTHHGYLWNYCRDTIHIDCDVERIGDHTRANNLISYCKKRLNDIKEQCIIQCFDEQNLFESNLSILKAKLRSLNLPHDTHLVRGIEKEAFSFLKIIESSQSYLLFCKLVMKKQQALDMFGDRGINNLIENKVKERIRYKIEAAIEETQKITEQRLAQKFNQQNQILEKKSNKYKHQRQSLSKENEELKQKISSIKNDQEIKIMEEKSVNKLKLQQLKKNYKEKISLLNDTISSFEKESEEKDKKIEEVKQELEIVKEENSISDISWEDLNCLLSEYGLN